MNIKFLNICIAVLVLFLLNILASCKADDGGEMTGLEADRAHLLEVMQGKWVVDEVRKDNVLISDFNDFVIEFLDMNFSSSNGNPVWPNDGSFTFMNEETAKEFRRLDGVSFSVIETTNGIQIEIKYTNPSNRRGIEGNYQYLLMK